MNSFAASSSDVRVASRMISIRPSRRGAGREPGTGGVTWFALVMLGMLVGVYVLFSVARVDAAAPPSTAVRATSPALPVAATTPAAPPAIEPRAASEVRASKSGAVTKTRPGHTKARPSARRTGPVASARPPANPY